MALDAMGAAGHDEHALGTGVAELRDVLPQRLAVRASPGVAQAVDPAAARGDRLQPRLAGGAVTGREAVLGFGNAIHRAMDARADPGARP